MWDMPGRVALIGLAGYLVVPLLMGRTFVIDSVWYSVLWLFLVLMIVLFIGGTTLWLMRLVRRKHA